MSIQAVLLPVFVQVFLTWIIGFILATRRGAAFKSGTKYRDIALREPNWPQPALQAQYSFANQFELPVLFYVVMIAGPITGWIIVSTARVQVPTLLFGVIPLPHLPVGRALHGPAEAAHSAMAWLAIAVFLMHVAGALRHQWLLGKPELQRMIPFARGRAVNTAIGAVLLVIAAMFVAKTVYPDKPKPEEAMLGIGNKWYRPAKAAPWVREAWYGDAA